jgi:hypothetical protein
VASNKRRPQGGLPLPGVVKQEDCQIYLRATIAQFNASSDVSRLCSRIRWTASTHTLEMYRKVKGIDAHEAKKKVS